MRVITYIVVGTLLSLSSAISYADPNLSVTFVNADPPLPTNTQCMPTALPTSSAFNLVITDVDANDPTVTIGSVTFNGHNGAEGKTGTQDPACTAKQASDPTLVCPDIITANSNSPTEQKYLLQSCNGKQLKYNQSCTIPLLFTYPVTSSQSSTTLTVGAETDVSSGNYSTASFTVGIGSHNSGVALSVYNIPQSISRTYTTSGYGALLPTGSTTYANYNFVGAYFDPATYQYQVTNNTSTAKTLRTYCSYTNYTARFWPGVLVRSIATSNQCGNISLAPGATCNATLTITPAFGNYDSCMDLQCYSGVSVLFSVYALNSLINAPLDMSAQSLGYIGNIPDSIQAAAKAKKTS